MHQFPWRISVGAAFMMLASVAQAEVINLFTENFEGSTNAFGVTPADLTHYGFSTNTSHAATFSSEGFGRLGASLNIPASGTGAFTVNVSFKVAVDFTPTDGFYIVRSYLQLSDGNKSYGGSGEWTYFRTQDSSEFTTNITSYGAPGNTAYASVFYNWTEPFYFDQSFTLTYLEIQFWAEQGAVAGMAYVDDVTIAVVPVHAPEPATAAILGMYVAAAWGAKGNKIRRKEANHAG